MSYPATAVRRSLEMGGGVFLGKICLEKTDFTGVLDGNETGKTGCLG